MSRIKAGFISGTLTDNPLTSAATTMNSAGLASLPVVSSPDVAAIVLDPNGSAGAPEIVWVTSHSSGATSATISRGQENTTAREHAQNIPWIHGPTTEDFSQSKEIFIRPSVLNGTLTPVNAMVGGGITPASLLDLDDYVNFVFLAPEDFNNLESAAIIFLNAGSSMTYEVSFLSAAVGGLMTGSPATQSDTQATSNSELDEIDITSLLSTLDSEHIAGIKMEATVNSAIYVLGLRIRYS